METKQTNGIVWKLVGTREITRAIPALRWALACSAGTAYRRARELEGQGILWYDGTLFIERNALSKLLVYGTGPGKRRRGRPRKARPSPTATVAAPTADAR
jgi:hypothetical protein